MEIPKREDLVVFTPSLAPLTVPRARLACGTAHVPAARPATACLGDRYFSKSWLLPKRNVSPRYAEGKRTPPASATAVAGPSTARRPRYCENDISLSPGSTENGMCLPDTTKEIRTGCPLTYRLRSLHYGRHRASNRHHP